MYYMLKRNEETMNNIVDTSIEFGGFYNSTHQADIEYRIDSDIEEKYIKDYDSIDWKKTHKRLFRNSKS